MVDAIVVRAVHDAEAGVWLIESSDVPGLFLEGDSVESLSEKLPGAILDLREASRMCIEFSLDTPVTLIAHNRILQQ